MMLERLHADALDVAFLSVNRLDAGPDIQVHPLLDEPLVALFAPGAPAGGPARRRHGRAARRALRRLRRGRRRCGGSSLQGAREAGFEPALAFESTESARIRAMASRGLGVALMPASEADHEGPPVAVVPVRGRALTRDVTLAWRAQRRHSPAARAFLDLAVTADAPACRARSAMSRA